MRQLLADGNVTSQKQLAEALGEAGYAVTQATVSRDLDALGAVRVKSDGNGTHYEILDDRFAFKQGVDSASKALNQFAETIASSGNIVIIHTAPGAAHLLASALDGAGLHEILGTVAGDDTIMVVASEGVLGNDLVMKLESMGAG
ncbi:MAG: arginine repressor [Acidimicrobiia bacterium]|nr:arginine repressor [Acidimicrobiia bacterium]